MFSNVLSLWGKGSYPLTDAFILANHIVPLSIAKKQRQPFADIESGPVFEQWNEFISKFPNGKNVKVVHGFLPTSCSMALGTLLFKNSPKVVAVVSGLVFLDPQAAMWFYKHEFAHIKHSDTLKQYVPIMITSIAASFFC